MIEVLNPGNSGIIASGATKVTAQLRAIGDQPVEVRIHAAIGINVNRGSQITERFVWIGLLWEIPTITDTA